MPGGVAEYDPELLASAPKATKAQLQSGYTIDLLDGKDYPSRSSARPGDPEAPRPLSDAGATTTVPKSSTEGHESPLIKAPPPRPFYRTRKGIIIIVLAFVAIVAVVVGVAVGVTQGGRRTTAPTPPPTQQPIGGTDPTPLSQPTQISGTLSTPVAGGGVSATVTPATSPPPPPTPTIAPPPPPPSATPFTGGGGGASASPMPTIFGTGASIVTLPFPT